MSTSCSPHHDLPMSHTSQNDYSQPATPSEFLDVHSHLPSPKPTVAQYSASAHSWQPGRYQVLIQNGDVTGEKWCSWNVRVCPEWIGYTRNVWPWIMGKMKFYTAQFWRQPIFGQRKLKSTERVWLWRFPKNTIFCCTRLTSPSLLSRYNTSNQFDLDWWSPFPLSL